MATSNDLLTLEATMRDLIADVVLGPRPDPDPLHEASDIWDGAADAYWAPRAALDFACVTGFLSIARGWEPLAHDQWRAECSWLCIPFVAVRDNGNDEPSALEVDLTTVHTNWRERWQVAAESVLPGGYLIRDRTYRRIITATYADARSLAAAIMAAGGWVITTGDSEPTPILATSKVESTHPIWRLIPDIDDQ